MPRGHVGAVSTTAGPEGLGTAMSVGIGTTGTAVDGVEGTEPVTERVSVVIRSGCNGAVGTVTGDGVWESTTEWEMGAGVTGLSVGAFDGMGPGVGIAVGGG